MQQKNYKIQYNIDVMVGGKEIELKDYGKIESTSIDYKEKVETKNLKAG